MVKAEELARLTKSLTSAQVTRAKTAKNWQGNSEEESVVDEEAQERMDVHNQQVLSMDRPSTGQATIQAARGPENRRKRE